MSLIISKRSDIIIHVDTLSAANQFPNEKLSLSSSSGDECLDLRGRLLDGGRGFHVRLTLLRMAHPNVCASILASRVSVPVGSRVSRLCRGDFLQWLNTSEMTASYSVGDRDSSIGITSRGGRWWRCSWFRLCCCYCMCI